MKRLFLLLTLAGLLMLCGCVGHEHTWNSADCENPKTCSVCGATEGSANGHNWKNADCEKPKTCSVCGATEGSANGHNWKNADCEKPKTCSVCGTTEGSANGHNWKNATCDEPRKCSVCKATDGKALGHKYNADGNCTVCGNQHPDIAELEKTLKIYGTWITVNSVGGVNVNITYENMSQKEIKYITFGVKLYNKVNDPIRCTISNSLIEDLKQTGPIPFGKGCYDCAYKWYPLFKGTKITEKEYEKDCDNGWAGLYWKNVWYNSTAYYVKIVNVKIEYMDGTEIFFGGEDLFEFIGVINLNIDDDRLEYDGNPDNDDLFD